MMDLVHKHLFSLSCLSLVLALLSGQLGMQVEARHHPSKKLFVFGDSYVDTGNTRKGVPGSWKDPYGVTFPGKPAGRFSDGRVLTDFIDLSTLLQIVTLNQLRGGARDDANKDEKSLCVLKGGFKILSKVAVQMQLKTFANKCHVDFVARGSKVLHRTRLQCLHNAISEPTQLSVQ